MILRTGIWLIDSPEHGEDVAERLLQYRSFGKIVIIRTTAIHVIKEVVSFQAFPSPGK
jgi:hypothetical protein